MSKIADYFFFSAIGHGDSFAIFYQFDYIGEMRFELGGGHGFHRQKLVV
jgi:hypothetical protein